MAQKKNNKRKKTASQPARSQTQNAKVQQAKSAEPTRLSGKQIFTIIIAVVLALALMVPIAGLSIMSSCSGGQNQVGGNNTQQQTDNTGSQGQGGDTSGQGQTDNTGSQTGQ